MYKEKARSKLRKCWICCFSREGEVSEDVYQVSPPSSPEAEKNSEGPTLVRNDPMPIYISLPGQCFEQEIEIPSDIVKPMDKTLAKPASRQMIRPEPVFLPPEEPEAQNTEIDDVKPVKKKKRTKSVTIQEEQIEVPPAETKISKKKKKKRKRVKVPEIIETPVEEICIKPEVFGDGKDIEDDTNFITVSTLIQVKEPTRPRTRYGWPDKRRVDTRSIHFVEEEEVRKHTEVSCEKKSDIPLIQKIEAEVKLFEDTSKLPRNTVSTTPIEEEKTEGNGNHGEIILDMAEEDEKDAIARATVSPEVPKSELIRKGLRRVSPAPEIEITVPPAMLEPSHVKFIEDGKEVTLETVLEESKKKSTKKKFRVPKRIRGFLQKVASKTSLRSN